MTIDAISAITKGCFFASALFGLKMKPGDVSGAAWWARGNYEKGAHDIFYVFQEVIGAVIKVIKTVIILLKQFFFDL